MQIAAGDLAADLAKVLDTLAATKAHLAGLDQADSARRGSRVVAYSPLRTQIEHAEVDVARVQEWLAERGRADRP